MKHNIVVSAFRRTHLSQGLMSVCSFPPYSVVVNVADKESIELAGTWRQDIHNHAVVSTKRMEKDGKVSKVTVHSNVTHKLSN